MEVSAARPTRTPNLVRQRGTAVSAIAASRERDEDDHGMHDERMSRQPEEGVEHRGSVPEGVLT